jgi:hypothetical protein
MNLPTASKKLGRLFAVGGFNRHLLPVIIDGHDLPAAASEEEVVIELWYVNQQA